MRIRFARFHRRENRRALAIFDRKEIAHLGAHKITRLCGGAVNIAATTAERESRDFGALSVTLSHFIDIFRFRRVSRYILPKFAIATFKRGHRSSLKAALRRLSRYTGGSQIFRKLEKAVAVNNFPAQEPLNAPP